MYPLSHKQLSRGTEGVFEFPQQDPGFIQLRDVQLAIANRPCRREEAEPVTTPLKSADFEVRRLAGRSPEEL